MSFPLRFHIGELSVSAHLVFEYLAFFVAYRYYVYLRIKQTDEIPVANRLSIILGATIGAFVGSRVVGILENPQFEWSVVYFVSIFNVKTIMGGLFGGLLGVETTKLLIGERRSSGDLFTLPIVLGIFVGRIGCFLAGTSEFTYGSETSLLTGMDLGDGIMRHPIALYELVFLLVLHFLLRYLRDRVRLPSGHLFRYFMIAYFGFRFLIEFIKPNVFFVAGLSSIQWLCIICFLYYSRTIIDTARYAYQKIHLL